MRLAALSTALLVALNPLILRWGIEPMFSDFKSRGFGLMQSHIEKPERVERLILVMAIAMGSPRIKLSIFDMAASARIAFGNSRIAAPRGGPRCCWNESSSVLPDSRSAFTVWFVSSVRRRSSKWRSSI